MTATNNDITLTRLHSASAWIHANPDRHDQNQWHGLDGRMCFAGVCDMLAGNKFTTDLKGFFFGSKASTNYQEWKLKRLYVLLSGFYRT